MPVKPLTALYEEVMQAKRNPRVLWPKLLESKPESLVIFRLILNMDQRGLAKILGISQGTIWSTESGHRKHLSANRALQIVSLVLDSTGRIPDLDELLKRRQEIAKRGKFFGDYAKKMANRSVSSGSVIKSNVRKEPTLQEKTLLEELKRQKITFQFHGVVKASRAFVVDFVFPSEKEPKVILEMKNLQSKYVKRMQAVELAYRAIKMHQSYPKAKLIAIIDGELQNSAMNIVKDEYDKVLQNASSRVVVSTVKGFIDSTV